MATAKLILDKRFYVKELRDDEKNIDENLYPLKLRIYKGTPSRDIPLPYKLKANQWVDNKISKYYPNSARENASLQKILSIATTTLSTYRYQIEKMHIEKVRELVKQEIEKKLNEDDQEVPALVEEAAKLRKEELISLREYGNIAIGRKRKIKEDKTANWYDEGIISVIKFNGGRDLMLPDITATFLKNYETEQIAGGMKKNSISAYLRAVRAVSNAAIKELLGGKRYEGYPWGVSYSIPSEKTKKRAATKEVIDAIRKKEFKERSALWHAKNYILFMFNCRGMNFIDLAKLRVGDIDERIEYRRSKNSRLFSIKQTKETLEILRYYLEGKKADDFVFPIGFEEGEKGLQAYEQKRKRYNKYFKRVAKEATGKDIDFTSYVIRHTWAGIAKKKGVSKDVIGEGLGHGDARTTDIYLEDFENDVLDEANAMVVE